MDDNNRVREDRLKKLAALRDEGVNPYANDFKPTSTCEAVLAEARKATPPGMREIAEDAVQHAVGGRVMFKNNMGKAMFIRVRDRSIGLDEGGAQTLQVYLRKDVLGEAAYQRFKKGLDVGDIVGVCGPLFTTRTGEATLMARQARLLTKSLRPLPDKFHGLSDVETRFRQRYVDLIVSPGVRKVFHQRSAIIAFVRRFFLEREFVEVETPMMHPIPGGARARPFETFHNALAMPLFLRVAPELYLKRLVVGGFERVFEINRNFRNEGLSPKHNPEFTMVEFYQAYATYEDLIEFTQELLSALARELSEDGTLERPYGDHVVNWQAPFARMTVKESVVRVGGASEDEVADAASLTAALTARGHEVEAGLPYGKLLMEAFDALVEHQLIQPTFITQYPVEASPLARRNEADPAYTDRFELFVAGAELGNAFSELNDPIDQKGRFEAQVAARGAGDKEAMFMDLDYVRALEYGMPPTAGMGIGIDRLVMLMTNQHSIREVLFFPHMRPQ